MKRTIVAGLAGLTLLAASACGSSSSSGSSDSTSSPAASDDSTSSHSAKAKAKPKHTDRVLLSLSGSGIKKSKVFKTGDSWTIRYSYNCASFGGKGNFAITTYDGTELQDVAVNDLGRKGKDTTQEYGSGAHHLEINSECKWKVKVTG